MSKQSNKRDSENEELGLILEQLIKSFGEEDRGETEDANSSDPDDNAEFNQMLQQIISGADTSTNISTSSSSEPILDENEFDESEFYAEISAADEITADLSESTGESIEDPADEPVDESQTVVNTEYAEAEEIVLKEEGISTEEEILAEKDSSESDSVITDDEVIEESPSPSLYEKSVDENQSESDVDDIFQLMFAGNSPSREDDIHEASFDEQPIQDKAAYEAITDGEVFEDEIIKDAVTDNEIFDDDGVDGQNIEFEDVEYEPIVEDEEYFNEAEQAFNDPEEEPVKLILDPEEYTFDPLQNTLPDFAHHIRASTGIKAPATQGASSAHSHFDIDKKDDLDDNDISLLLKFGYSEEVKSRIGETEAQIAIAESGGKYVPESHKISYGFCGNELSDKKDVRRIRDKFKSDKALIIVQLVLISILTVMAIALEGFFEFFSDRSSYLALCAAEIVIIAVAFAILYKKLISGILGIARFEANLYSVLAYLIFIFGVCNIITALVYLIKSPSIDIAGLTVFGVCILFYIILTLVAELMNCIRESNAFELMCGSDSFYTAEKHEKRNSEKSSVRVGSSGDGNEYRLIRTSLLSGFFRKSSSKASNNINLIYVIGIVPILSLIVGCVSAIIGGDVMRGLSSMMMTTLLCIPFVYIIVPSATEYIWSSFFKSQKIAFIGKSSVEDLARADALYFDDTDSIEIISYTEIHPSKSVDGEKDLAIARKVFRSLDGPLGEFSLRLEEEADSNDKGEVIINSITENGIDIYFDSSINILIGDKSYMLAHNIKVKTDSNLNTAIKGFDRSVIYMAFDGIPKLGFIITSKLRPQFSEIARELDESGIRVCVDTYEPQISDTYFEQNKQNDVPSVSVYKSEEYESTDYKPICDGSIVCASDCYSLARAIVRSREIVRRRKKNQRTHFALILTGFIFSCILTALINVDGSIFILGGLKYHVSLLFNLIMLASLTPGIVGIVRTARSLRKKTESTKETK